MDTQEKQQALLEQLWSIATADATDILEVADGVLSVRPTRLLTSRQRNAIASIERSSGGLKVKLYDKLKALELLGKHMGLFDGVEENPEPCNLLTALIAAAGKEVNTDDIPELQQAADDCHDVVEQAGA